MKRWSQGEDPRPGNATAEGHWAPQEFTRTAVTKYRTWGWVFQQQKSVVSQL